MGVVGSISYDDFPEQSFWKGCRVKVCYHYDTSKTHLGTIVRSDRGHPNKTIIKLDNGNYILAEECMYQVLD